MSKISTKNILKKIFKGKTDKKVKKKVSKKKVAKVKKAKKSKKAKKIISKKIKKVAKKVSPKLTKTKKTVKITETTNEPKVDNLRISKTNEVKPEIKKVKKQETEKREYKIKDHVVYPKHGVGQIIEFKKITIGGIDVETYVIKFEKDKANGMVPVNKQSHLRPLATINQVNKCISILKSKPKIKRSMWSRRAQEYEAKISSGKIYELAEVVRDLNKGDDLMVDQSYSERQLFEKAYERILSEFQIILNVSLEDTQKKLDKALKRNLGGQSQAVVVAKTPTNELTVEDEFLVQQLEQELGCSIALGTSGVKSDFQIHLDKGLDPLSFIIDEVGKLEKRLEAGEFDTFITDTSPKLAYQKQDMAEKEVNHRELFNNLCSHNLSPHLS